MIDKFLAVVSLACLIGFMGVIIWFVPDPDLVIVTIIVLAMAVYDFYREAFRKGGGKSD